jgi:polyhydroxyalkanoate synthase subunit PhaC
MTNTTSPPAWDAVAIANQLQTIAGQSQSLMQRFLSRQPAAGQIGMGDASTVGSAFLELMTKMMSDPVAVANAQIGLFNEGMMVWRHAAERMFLMQESLVEPARDKRFKHPDWTENAMFSFIRESYLVAAKSLLSSVRDVKGLDPPTARKVDFYTRQFVDGMSPSNFIATNPEVLTTTLQTGGQNLLRGLENLLADLDRGEGRPSITMTDMKSFRLGENIATTSGKVIYQNELMQLIQYAAAPAAAHRAALDQQVLRARPAAEEFFHQMVRRPGTHGVRHLRVNPDERLAQKSFENYMLEGPLAALDALDAATGERSVNAVGYCLGGTLLASTLAYLAAHGDDRIASATYFVTLVDFTEVGDMAVFIDEEQIYSLEKRMQQRGYLEAHDMATSFNMLRANDLIWSFVVNNYLLGKEQVPFDLLFWNSDSTRMPAAMPSFYLRNMYQRNLLAKPGGITLAGTPIDLSRIEAPTFLLSSREDHIAPWKSTYAATRLYAGPVKFVLAASGHMAGVISAPGSKYGHWTNDELPATPDAWLDGARSHQGSWWPLWDEWVTPFGLGRVSPRSPGDGRLAPIEDAPGSYVRVRSDD